MAGMKFKIEADVEKLNQLKTKMNELKQSMVDMSKAADPKVFKETEKALKDTEKQYESLGKQVQKSTEQMAQSGQAGSTSIQNINVPIKQAIREQKQLIAEIKADIKSLEGQSKANPNNKGILGDLSGAKKSLAEEQGALIGMQRKQMEVNAEEEASQGGIIAGLGKWAIGLMSLAAVMKVAKQVIDSAEVTAHSWELVTSQASAATTYFFKTIASGDWSGFMEGIGKAIAGAREYVNAMEELNNQANEQKIKSSSLDIKIGEARANTYSTDPKVVKENLQILIKLQTEKLTGEAKIAKDAYELKRKKVADENGWNEKSLENTIQYYSKNKKILEDGERYIALMQARKANAGGMVGESYVKANKPALAKIDTELLTIPNGAYAGDAFTKFGKVTFPERDELAKLKADAQDKEAAININNRRDKQRLIGIQKQEEAAANAAAKSAADERIRIEKEKNEYLIDLAKQRKSTMFDIEQQTLDLEKDGFEKTRKQNELNYRKTLADIEQRKQDMLKKQNEVYGGINLKTGKKTKTYNPVLNSEDQTQVDSLNTLAKGNWDAADKKVLEGALKEFETYQEKRLRIIKEYDEKILLLKGTAAENEAKFQKQEALDAIDKQIAARSAIYAKWAKELTTKSLDDMSALLSDYESMSVQLNKDGSLMDDDKAVLREKIRALQARIKELSSDKNVAKESKKDNSETLKAMNEINEAAKNIISSFEGMDATSKLVFTGIVNIASGVIAALTGISKAGEAATAAEKASVILAVLGAILQVYNAIKSTIDGIIDAHNAAAEAAQEAARNKFLGELQYLESLRAEYEWTQKIGEAKLDYIARQGAALKVQAAENKSEQDSLFGKLQGSTYTGTKKGWHKEEGMGGYGYGKYEGDVSLAGKSYEDIALLSEKGLLSKDAEAYYEALKKAKAEGKDIEQMSLEYLESVKETFTGSTRSGIVDSIIEGFKAGKRSAADFADTFEKLMQGAVQAALALFVDDKVNAWFEKFAAYSESGGELTKAEQDELRKDWDILIADSNKKADDLKKVTGVDVTDSSTSSSTSGSSSNFSSMSQDTGDELNGRFTALQISGQNIEQYNLSIDANMKGLLDIQIVIGDNVAKQLEYMEMSHTVQLQSMWHLKDIALYTKVLPKMAEDIARVKSNTERL